MIYLLTKKIQFQSVDEKKSDLSKNDEVNYDIDSESTI